jgi:hypothetical protein
MESRRVFGELPPYGSANFAILALFYVIDTPLHGVFSKKKISKRQSIGLKIDEISKTASSPSMEMSLPN